MKKQTIDFKEVRYHDLNGTEYPIPDVWAKGFGNAIYLGGDIPTSELGSKIYHSDKNDKVVDLDQEELTLLLNIIEHSSQLGAPAQRALKAYLTYKLDNLNNQ